MDQGESGKHICLQMSCDLRQEKSWESRESVWDVFCQMRGRGRAVVDMSVYACADACMKL